MRQGVLTEASSKKGLPHKQYRRAARRDRRAWRRLLREMLRGAR